MARDILGNRIITKEDMYTKKAYLKTDFRWEYYKIVVWLTLGYAYFHFVIAGWTW